ncbi:cell separation during budding [Quaeritorhiza haematococci]|nr:cell separation during budding [Quaeritorhiza haematococci]
MVAVNADDPVEVACEALIVNGISSAPVWDKSRNTFVGMLDYRDVVTYVLIALRKDKQPIEDASVEVQELVRRARAQEPITAELTSDLSHKNPFYSVMPQTPLRHAVELFGQGIHRVVIVSADVQGILSQSQAMKFLWNNSKRFPELEPVLSKTLAELGLGNKHVVSVSGDTMVIDALRVMSNNDVSSVPVLNPNGSIMGSVSMSDIKWIMKTLRFGYLYQSAHAFVSFIDQQQGILDGRDRFPVFDVYETSTLGYAMQKMVATKAHRVWVVDKNLHKPISVISLTDVMRVLAMTPQVVHQQEMQDQNSHLNQHVQFQHEQHHKSQS